MLTFGSGVVWVTPSAVSSQCLAWEGTTERNVPRPPVIFCKDGDARVVVRRERLDELTARDAG